MTDETVDGEYLRRVGDRLRRVRRQKLLSLQAVESASGQEFKASVLGAYERGERAISVPRLQRLAQFYSVPVDQLLPQEQDAVVDPPGLPTGARRGKIVIDLEAVDENRTPERELVRRFVNFIQVKRQDFNGKVLTIRSTDLDLLAAFADTTPERLYQQLAEAGLVR